MIRFSSIKGSILVLKIGDNLIWYGTLCRFKKFSLESFLLSESLYSGISTRCEAIFSNTYFDLNSWLNEFRNNFRSQKVLERYVQSSKTKLYIKN